MKSVLKHNVLAKGFEDNIQFFQKETDLQKLKEKAIFILRSDQYVGAMATRNKWIAKVETFKNVNQMQNFVYNFILAGDGMKTI